jgi:hypothetical protein
VYKLFTAWHINIAYSAVEISDREILIRECYWPLLKLLENNDLVFGIEISGYSLQAIHDLDPAWVTELRKLVKQGRVEIIASGWSQVIAPLVPWEVNLHNFNYGKHYLESTLETSVNVAFVNEQCWSKSLTELYSECGFKGIVMEWENPSSNHTEWPPEYGFQVKSVEFNGCKLPVLWNSSTAFQKLQRLAHGDISIQDWQSWLAESHRSAPENSVFCIYGGDVETFGFRPKRYTSEAKSNGNEWKIVLVALLSAQNMGFEFTLPSSILENHQSDVQAIDLVSLNMPLPTKKQPKYNPLRWATGGPDAVLANSRCFEIFSNQSQNSTEKSWKELIELWSSDYRTHITGERWKGWEAKSSLMSTEEIQKVGTLKTGSAEPKSMDFSITTSDLELRICNENIEVILNPRKGCSLKSLAFPKIHNLPIIGSYQHGTSRDIAWNADFYSMEFCFDQPGGAKVTDLIPVLPSWEIVDSFVIVSCDVNTALGLIRKIYKIDGGDNPSIEVSFKILWDLIPIGSLRLADLVLNPILEQGHPMTLAVANGGKSKEVFKLDKSDVDHGRTWSNLISAQQCFGMTDTELIFGFGNFDLLVSTAKSETKLPALLTHIDTGNVYLTRLTFSMRELDDTSSKHSINLPEIGRSFNLKLTARRVQT